MTVTIRTFQPGDEVAQVSIFNEAAGDLPKFKPATIDEVRRRLREPDFDAGQRFYAVESGKPVGYVVFNPSGRISVPWCRKGHEKFAQPLFDAALNAMRERGQRQAWAAYRSDWPGALALLQSNGFTQAREMINYVLDLAEMPTPAARTTTHITPLTPDDLAAVMTLGAGVLRCANEAELHKALFHNRYLAPESLYCLRGRADGQPLAVAVLVTRAEYAKPHQLDAMMPCFRLGAFGTEGLTHKRVNGLFSVLAADSRDLMSLGLDLLAHASNVVADIDVETFAAQSPSDAAHLVRFYKSLFRRQGSFPIFTRELIAT